MNLMFMIPYIFDIFDCNSDEMHTDVYVFFVTLYLLYKFRVLFAPIIRSTNCRVQPYVRVIVMVCWKLDSPLEQVAAGTPSHLQHGQLIEL
jgi:hypothetical protein